MTMLFPTLVVASAALFGPSFVQTAPRPAPAATPPATAPTAAPATPPVTPPSVRPPMVPPAAPPAMLDELPPIDMTPAVLNMGVAAPKAGMHGTVQLKNTSDKPLKILAITPSCKCTTVSDMAGKIIPAGGSVTLEAALEPVSMPQTQKAAVRILIEGYGKVLELQVRGEVALAVRANPTLINAVEGKPRQGRFVVETIDEKPFTICAIGGRKPEYVGFHPGVDAPKNKYVVKYDLDSWGAAGYPAYLVVETDRVDCPTFDVWVRTERTIPKPGFRMKDYRANVGRVDVGGTAVVTLEMDDSGEDMIAVESASKDIDMELVGQSGDGKLRKVDVRIKPKATHGGLLYTPFTLFGREKEQAMVLFGTLRPKGATGCAGCDAAEPPPPAPVVDKPMPAPPASEPVSAPAGSPPAGR